MKRSRRLETLVKLAQLAERGARERLAQSNRELQRREQQQQQLESYEQEYATRWLAAGRDGIAGAELAQLGAFRASLADTLAIQQRSGERYLLDKLAERTRPRPRQGTITVFDLHVTSDSQGFNLHKVGFPTLFLLGVSRTA